MCLKVIKDNMTIVKQMIHDALSSLVLLYSFLKIVMFGGHIDSWDVGVGAMDDGGGMMVTRQVVLP